MKSNTSNTFGKYLLDDFKLKKLVPHSTFKKYIKSKTNGTPLEPKTLNAILKAIMAWAISEGATHYAHIFYPLSRPTAEKQVAFLSIKDGKTTTSVPPCELMSSEVDASSFPNGDECPPHKAKGYAMWDISSSPYIAPSPSGDKTLYLPSTFLSASGISLGEKTPLLRATKAVDIETKRILKMLKLKTPKVICNVGAEQEFFLLKTEPIKNRYDICTTGHALIDNTLSETGNKHHYLSRPNPDIMGFFDDLTCALWEKGITAKIRHSEVSPSQYEITTIFGEANKICNQDCEIMHSISVSASKFKYTPLFHEKPALNLNGSGKHINLSFCTSRGLNLLDPTTTPFYIFYVFFTAFVVAIDICKNLIASSTNYYSNTLRLGQKEAPPNDITIHIGEDLYRRINNFDPQKATKKPYKDLDDNRNRTSPLAFVKNRFEFRMAGSSAPIATPITYIYMAYASTLKQIANEAEKTKGNKIKAILEVSKKLFEAHKNVIYNGNNYIRNLCHTPHQTDTCNFSTNYDKGVAELGVFSDTELNLRWSIQKQKYIGDLTLDCIATDRMLNKYIFPSLVRTLEFYKNSPLTQKGGDIFNTIATATDNLYKLQSELSSIVADASTLGVDEKLKWLTRFAPRKLGDISGEYKKIKDLIPKEFETFPSLDEVFENE